MPAVLLVASQVLYVADTTTFGCSSIDETARLQRIRSIQKAFEAELYGQIFEGQCVQIDKGKVVEGSIEGSDASVLRVDRQFEPPGFLAPRSDFHRLESANGKK